METKRTIRRLVAILVSDVVGYSTLMEADENSTLTKLNRLRGEVFNPAIARHNGRVVKLMGDGALVEFSSVFDAVDCATVIQTELAERPVSLQLRIGANLGEFIIQDEDIYGDGVNIAARLESLAKPGGVCISTVVQEST